MNTRETLILKALELKSVYSGASTDSLLDTILAQNPDKADAITKNVCARIPLQLADQMEQLGGLLNLNKREIITLAIVDFLEKANGVMDEFNAWPEQTERTGFLEVVAIDPTDEA